jgi:transcriptional regulator with XRE-family HTH domain
METSHMGIEIKLRDARENAGFTQEQVAEKIMVSRQTVSNWENGKFLPDIVSIIKLSELYGISIDELLKGDKKMQKKIEKDANLAKWDELVIAATGFFSFIFLIAALIGNFAGDSYDNFCQNAVEWILAIGTVFISVYLSKRNKR